MRCVCVVCVADAVASRSYPCYSWNHELNLDTGIDSALNVDTVSCIGDFDMKIEMDLKVFSGEVICNRMHTVQS